MSPGPILRNREVVHPPFSPPPVVVDALRAHAAAHDYLPTAGLPALREEVAAFYHRHFRIEATPDRIAVSPGSKEMISILLAVLEGPVLVPVPSWVSYMPQARILQKDTVPLRLRGDEGFKLTPERLREGVARAGGGQSILILNHPHNPTGAVYARAELEALAEPCRRHDVVVIADEIYALTAFDGLGFTSMGEVYPEGTIVTGGLSKDRSSGGYRLGVAVFPDGEERLLSGVLKVAGSTYSCVAAPIQHAAVAAYAPDEAVESHMRDCAAVNAFVGQETSALFGAAGIPARPPCGAFYQFVDWSAEREALVRLGLSSSSDVAEDVLHVEHVAMLPGRALLLGDEEIAFRCSYVDYDGDRALADWRRRSPKTPDQRRDFVRRNCPLLVDGAAYLGRYLSQVRDGRRPRHA